MRGADVDATIALAASLFEPPQPAVKPRASPL